VILSRAAKRAAPFAAPLLLAACASVTPQPPPAGGESFSGRLSLRVAGDTSAPVRSTSASFELMGSAQQGSFSLDTPLGTTLAVARWQPGRVTLSTPQGESAHADLAALTREALGEELPVAALFDWLHGRPWAGADSTPTTPPAPVGFSQLGWTVDVARLAQDWLVAERPGTATVTVRIKLDRR